MPTHVDIAALEARVVRRARELDPEVEVIEIDPAFADTADFLAEYGYSAEESANCILVASRTGGEPVFAACLVQATRRLDLNRRSRLIVGARKASFATAEQTVAVTGMVPGGVTPIGLPDGLPLFVDTGVMAQERIIVGGGGRGVKLRLRPTSLADLADVVVTDIGQG
jgi:prolyl-tRNA editing enzyme YbaK/EbsC (Cys-tRNA(Pro) deacylase)